jgi:hypothetical protein
MSKRKTVRIGDFVTDEMFAQIKVIGLDVAKIATEVMTPNMAEINRKTGQENDPHYLAYAVVYAMGQAGLGGAE